MKKKKFRKLSITSAITQVALGLLTVRKDGKSRCAGSAMLILPNLALTAKHVIKNGLAIFEPGIEFSGAMNTETMIVTTQFFKGGGGNFYHIRRVWFNESDDDDFAIIELWPDPRQTGVPDWQWSPTFLSFEPPSKFATVFAVGYSNEVGEVHTRPAESIDGIRPHLNLYWKDGLMISEGKVTKVLPNGSEKPRLRYPCFKVGMQVDDGMSGGPVFDGGICCGIITHGATTFKDSQSHNTTCSTLEPLLNLQINAPVLDVFDGTHYFYVRELFERNILREYRRIPQSEGRIYVPVEDPEAHADSASGEPHV